MTLLTVIPIALLSGGVALALPPALLFERGVYEESILDDIDTAMKSYEAVWHDSRTGPRTRVEAAFRLGECHEDLEHPLTAWVHFDTVTRSKHTTENIVDLAMHQKVMLLIELAENLTVYSPELLHHTGDLILGLEGALRHSERARALRLLDKFEKAVQKLRLEADNHADETLLEEMALDAERLRKNVEKQAYNEAHAYFRSRPYQGAFAGREALSDENEVFGYALERLDEVTRALNAGQSLRAHEHLQSLQHYLKPLHPWPLPESKNHREVRRYLAKLITLANSLESPILRNTLGTARLMIDDFVKGQEKHPMPHWHIDSEILPTFANPEVLPHYGIVSLLLNAMVERLNKEELEAATAFLQEALDRVKRLRDEKEGTSDEPEATAFHEALVEMKTMLERGDTEGVRARFETAE